MNAGGTSSPELLWSKFVAQNPAAAESGYEAWSFGGENADMLAGLAESGAKTATSSAFPLYALENEPVPAAGEYSVLCRTDGTAVCIIRTTRVRILPFCAVTEEMAALEGEGGGSLAYWQRIHKAFFTDELREFGMRFSEDMDVVFEEFAVVFRE